MHVKQWRLYRAFFTYAILFWEIHSYCLTRTGLRYKSECERELLTTCLFRRHNNVNWSHQDQLHLNTTGKKNFIGGLNWTVPQVCMLTMDSSTFLSSVHITYLTQQGWALSWQLWQFYSKNIKLNSGVRQINLPTKVSYT